MFRPVDVSKRRLRLGQSLSNLYGDINNISWPSGPSGLWTNQLTSDGKLADLSGNGNHGTISGATFRAGPWGPCLYFDGVDDQLTFTNKDLTIEEFNILMLISTQNVPGAWHSIFKIYKDIHNNFTMGYNSPYYTCFGELNSVACSIGNVTTPKKYFELWNISFSKANNQRIFRINNVINQQVNSFAGNSVLNYAISLGNSQASFCVHAFGIWSSVFTSDERASIQSQLFGSW
jgi:hypothetical protein